MQRILVTGSTGFFGKNLKCKLGQNKSDKVYYSDSRFDLLDPNRTLELFRTVEPDIVIHMAGRVGGIYSNSLYPADYFYENMMMGLNIFNMCKNYQVDKLVTLIGGCSYPALAKSPISESDMWEGYPQIESAGYSVAKKTFLTMSDSYRQQYGLNSLVLIPGNAYGPHDNFSLEESHVIPAIIRKVHQAKTNRHDYIELFGSGLSIRDFVYIEDVVDIILKLSKTYNSSSPINISSGIGISIKDLAEKITSLMDFSGKIIWNTNKPEGQKIKVFDVKQLNSMGLFCNTSLDDGLKKTIDWFNLNYDKLI